MAAGKGDKVTRCIRKKDGKSNRFFLLFSFFFIELGDFVMTGKGDKVARCIRKKEGKSNRFIDFLLLLLYIFCIGQTFCGGGLVRQSDKIYKKGRMEI